MSQNEYNFTSSFSQEAGVMDACWRRASGVFKLEGFPSKTITVCNGKIIL